MVCELFSLLFKIMNRVPGFDILQILNYFHIFIRKISEFILKLHSIWWYKCKTMMYRFFKFHVLILPLNLFFFISLAYSGAPSIGLQDEHVPGFANSEVDDTLTKVQTLPVKKLNVAKIQTGGNIQLAAEVAARGVCWNTKGEPTITDEAILGGEGPGEFRVELGGLKKGTTYYLRAYAKVGENFIYGNEQVFTTDLIIKGVTIPMKYIEGGTFKMGCTNEDWNCYGDEYPVHSIQMESFSMSQYEITNEQYCAFLNSIQVDESGRANGILYIDIGDEDCGVRFSGSTFSPKEGKWNNPVSEITWVGAQAFSQWIGCRLPTEAEWEYAARGGQKARDTKFSGSNDVNEVAWYQQNSDGHCHEVGTKAPNELGLYDMSGNVWEWCYDYYKMDYYLQSPSKNPSGPPEGNNRVLRGGSWNMDKWNCRVSNRGEKDPELTYSYYGFRILLPSN
mgnify:CR=1 FL=1